MKWWLVLLILAPSALAHATPYQSTPTSLTGLPEPPEFVYLEFSEALKPESKIAIFDDQLLRRDTGNGTIDPDNPKAVRLYTGNLIRGIYTISYETVSAEDGHTERGSLPFTIGVPYSLSREDPFAPAPSDVSTEAIGWLLERLIWALFLGGLAMQALGGAPRLLWTAAPLAVMQPTIAIPLVLVAIAATRMQFAWPAAAAIYLYRLTLDGHAGREGEWLLQSAHGLAMLTWVGALWVALRWPGNWRRFSAMATAAVGVLFVSVLWLLRVRLQTPSDLLTTTYGMGMLAKILLAAGMLWFAWKNRSAIKIGAPKHLGREAALGAIVLGVTALIAFAPIPGDRAPVAPSYVEEGWWGDQYITMDIWPALPDGTLRPGQHEITLTFNDHVEHVEMAFTHRILDVGSIRAVAHKDGDVYRVEGTQLGAPGAWDVEIFYNTPGDDTRRAWFIVDNGPLGHVHGGVKITDPHFDTGYLSLGDSFTRYFGEPDQGRFECHCHPHQWMECEIVVRDDLPAASHTVRIIGDIEDPPGTYRFEPANLEIGVGSTVTWINDGNDPHTATNVQWYQAQSNQE